MSFHKFHYIKRSDEDDIPLEQGDVWPWADPGLHPGPALDNYKPTNFQPLAASVI